MQNLLSWLRPSKRRPVVKAKARACRPSLEQLGERVVPAAFKWTGAVSAAWENSGNWTDMSNNPVLEYPGQNRQTDDATFAGGYTRSCVLSASNLVIEDLYGESSYGSGKLDLRKTLSLSGGGGYWKSGSVMFGSSTAGELFISNGSLFTFQDAGGFGYLAGGTGWQTGEIYVNSTSELDLAPSFGNTMELSADIMNQGTVSTLASAGTFAMDTYSTTPLPWIDNQGTWDFNSTTANANDIAGNNHAIVFTNEGQLTVAESTKINMGIDNKSATLAVNPNVTFEVNGDAAMGTLAHGSLYQEGTLPLTDLGYGSTTILHNDAYFAAGNLGYDSNSAANDSSTFLYFQSDHATTCQLTFNFADLQINAEAGNASGTSTTVGLNNFFIQPNPGSGGSVQVTFQNYATIQGQNVVNSMGNQWSLVKVTGSVVMDDGTTTLQWVNSGASPAPNAGNHPLLWATGGISQASGFHFGQFGGYTGTKWSDADDIGVTI